MERDLRSTGTLIIFAGSMRVLYLLKKPLQALSKIITSFRPCKSAFSKP